MNTALLPTKFNIISSDTINELIKNKKPGLTDLNHYWISVVARDYLFRIETLIQNNNDFQFIFMNIVGYISLPVPALASSSNSHKAALHYHITIRVGQIIEICKNEDYSLSQYIQHLLESFLTDFISATDIETEELDYTNFELKYPAYDLTFDNPLLTIELKEILPNPIENSDLILSLTSTKIEKVALFYSLGIIETLKQKLQKENGEELNNYDISAILALLTDSKDPKKFRETIRDWTTTKSEKKKDKIEKFLSDIKLQIK